MDTDHLDKETSVSAELTPTTLKASAKSRLVAAIDRLGGNVVEMLNAPMEARTSAKRAEAEAKRRVLQEITQLGLDRLKNDSKFAERAFETYLGRVFESQENKDAVLAEAIEDLRREPPTDQESLTGPEELSGAFQNRFERYAEEATTAELREKWGRVLAAEIRKPDTFSSKVLRVIDELDHDTAKLFERVCQYRIVNTIPKSLLDPLSFIDGARLTNADLLIEPGLGQVRKAVLTTDGTGAELWFWQFVSTAIAATKMPIVSAVDRVIQEMDGVACIPAYVLTDVGCAVPLCRSTGCE